MENTFVILLYKLFELKIMLEDFYKNLTINGSEIYNYALKNTAAILAAEGKKQIDSCRKIVKKSEQEEEYIINNDIMGQLDFNIIKLKQSLTSYGISTAGQLIAKAIDIENKQIFILTQIIDMLKSHTPPEFIEESLTVLLKEEQKYLSNLLPFNK